jgi:hypothetical protein
MASCYDRPAEIYDTWCACVPIKQHLVLKPVTLISSQSVTAESVTRTQYLPSEPEIQLKFIQIGFKNSVRTAKKTTLHCYKTQLVNAVYRKNRCLFWV